MTKYSVENEALQQQLPCPQLQDLKEEINITKSRNKQLWQMKCQRIQGYDEKLLEKEKKIRGKKNLSN